VIHQTINTSFNFIALRPNTDYVVDVISLSSTCSGIPKQISVTTSTREAGIPRSELALLHMHIATYVPTKFKKIIYLVSYFTSNYGHNK